MSIYFCQKIASQSREKWAKTQKILRKIAVRKCWGAKSNWHSYTWSKMEPNIVGPQAFCTTIWFSHLFSENQYTFLCRNRYIFLFKNQYSTKESQIVSNNFHILHPNVHSFHSKQYPVKFPSQFKWSKFINSNINTIVISTHSDRFFNEFLTGKAHVFFRKESLSTWSECSKKQNPYVEKISKRKARKYWDNFPRMDCRRM